MAFEETKLCIPTIDLSDLKEGSHGWELVKSQVMKASEEYGCFKIVFNKFSLENQRAIKSEMKELFDLPLQTKLLNVSNHVYGGYIGNQPRVPLYESFGFGDPNNLDELDSLINVLFPQGKQTLRELIHSLSVELTEMERTIRRMIFESMGVENYLHEHLNSTQQLFRVMKYEPPKTASQSEIALRAHTDQNAITILYQINEVDALQVKSKDGEEWIDVNLSPDSVLIIIAESLQAWTNDRLHSARHRVATGGKRTRYSCGLFVGFDNEFQVKVPEVLVNYEEGRPLLYKPFKYGELVKFSKMEGSRNHNSVVKAFSGV